jgi:DNA-binding transcriptional MerR regulator
MAGKDREGRGVSGSEMVELSAAGQDREELLGGSAEPRVGYRGPTVCKIVGISYRQLDYWARTELVRPSVQEAQGSGTQRLYSFDDLVELRVIKRLLDTGVSLQRVRSAVEELRRRGARPGDVTLMSDGESVYALDDQRDVIDLLARGQGVFAIALGPVVEELRGEVTEFPTEEVRVDATAETEPDAPPEADDAPTTVEDRRIAR